ncbi:MAG: peptidylprolyl isomerase [Tenuifilaceae bacterium]|nr:peptidylprolyl isomerase [Tenuifilaceae bacterium]
MKTKLSKVLLATFMVTILLSSCQTNKLDEQVVLIETEMGNIKVKLYNKTPEHRDNFIKLVKENHYNNVLFHRVINQFMVQGGDVTTSPNFDSTKLDPNYTLKAEIYPELFHKKGALAAARMGDDVNPEKNSSGTQFYIVQGKIFTVEELDNLTKKKNNLLQTSIINRMVMEKADEQYEKGIEPDFTLIYKEMKDTIDLVISKTMNYQYTDEQKQTYLTVGGTPHLDGNYTVFGEVIEGLDVIDKIAATKTNPADKPLKDIKMKMKVLK